MQKFSLLATSQSLGRTVENKAETGLFPDAVQAQAFADQWAQNLNSTNYSNATDWLALPVNQI